MKYRKNEKIKKIDRISHKYIPKISVWENESQVALQNSVDEFSHVIREIIELMVEHMAMAP